MAHLGLEQDALLQKMKRIEAGHSPWSRLPVEVVSDILVAGTEIEDLSRNYLPGGPAGVTSRRFPLVASAISSEFRAIALSTPLLWRNIYLGRPALPPLSEEEICSEDHPNSENAGSDNLCNDHRKDDLMRSFAQLDEASLWLKRSQATPLNIYIVNPVSSYFFPSFLFLRLILL